MSDDDPTFLRQRGIRKRMQCSGQVAHQIDEAFVTVEQLVEAVESDNPLTEYDGIGPTTAETIEDWWDNRFEREEQIGSSSVEETGAKTATIHFHASWSDAIGDRPEPDDSTEEAEIEESHRCEECGELPELVEEAAENPLTGDEWDRYQCECEHTTVRVPA